MWKTLNFLIQIRTLGGVAVTANFLLEIARWTKFLSILGFVGIGLIVLMALFAGAFLSLLPTAVGNSFTQ